MYIDKNLILATSEAPPDAGAVASLGADSVALGIDLAHDHTSCGIGISELSSSEMELEIQIDTSFGIAANLTCDFQLVSLPIMSGLANATTEGKHTNVVTGTVAYADDLVDISSHGLPLGTPCYFSAGSGGSGLATNTIYYTTEHSDDGNSFKLATTFANAVAGTAINHGSADFTGSTLEFIPYIHASTGPISGAFLNAGNRFTARCQPFSMGPSPASVIPNATSQTSLTPYGVSGGGLAPTPGRYLALRYDGTTLGTDGRISAHLAINTQEGQKYFPTASVIA
tara:strand:- start:622 stop:1473 length:852 start_codon:yes stop_codon:yes gene_type:complete